jgi:predicted Zn-dependent peptidase
MTTLAARIGAHIEIHRTQQALVYELSGSLADLDFLGWILREGLKAPSPSTFEEARRTLRSDLERQLETPQGVLQARSREALAPGSGSVLGSLNSLDRLNPSSLHSFWARTHRTESVRIVVAGRIPGALVLASLGELGLSTESIPSPSPQASLGASRATPQVVRSWVVQARLLPQESEAAALVGARWIGELLWIADGDFESAVEIWDLPSGRALVLTGAAYPRSRQEMERRIAAILSEAADRLTPAITRRIADELRTEILLSARTPWGLAALVGQAWDTGHGPDEVETFLETLRTLDVTGVQSLFRTLAATSPIRSELRP